MSLHRFHSKELLPTQGSFTLKLSEQEMHHFRVLRIHEGEKIALFDNEGNAIEAICNSISNSNIEVMIENVLKQNHLPHITLVQGVSKGERMTQTIRQCTELGIERIIPYLSDRSIVRLNQPERHKKGDRFRSVAESAAKQCGRSVIPCIADPCNQKEVISQLDNIDILLLAWEENKNKSESITDALAKINHNANVAIVIGPEGGFSPEEVECFHQDLGTKVHNVQLGELILRTETAAVVACALASAQLGGLGHSKKVS